MAKIALITGGSSGLGFAMAELLGAQGYSLILLARNQTKLDNAVAALKAKNITAKAISCSITDEEGLKKVTTDIKSEFGSIDYLILNAGQVSTKLLTDYTSPTELKQDLEVDLWGTILSAYQFTPLLNKGAKVLLISSGFGLMGAAGYTMYCAAKAGIINFGEALRRELLHKDINVYVATPGDMDTEQFHNEIKNAPEWMKKEAPRKLQKTADAAAKILKQAKGKRKFLIVPASDINLLVTLTRILPRKFRDYLLDDMFPRPTDIA